MNILEILMIFGYIAAACCAENIWLCAGLCAVSFLSGFVYKILWCRGMKK